MFSYNCQNSTGYLEMFNTPFYGGMMNIGQNNGSIFNVSGNFNFGNNFSNIFNGMFNGGINNFGFGMNPFGMGNFGFQNFWWNIGNMGINSDSNNDTNCSHYQDKKSKHKPTNTQVQKQLKQLGEKVNALKANKNSTQTDAKELLKELTKAQEASRDNKTNFERFQNWINDLTEYIKEKNWNEELKTNTYTNPETSANTNKNDNIITKDVLVQDEEIFSVNSLNNFINNNKNIINILAKEDDNKNKIEKIVNQTIKIAKLMNVDANDLQTIQEEIQTNFSDELITKINTAYLKVFNRIKSVNPEISSSKISNQYYTSDKTYTKIITDKNIIIIDTATNEITDINLSNLLSPFNEKEQSTIITSLKEMNAEALLDIATEVTFTDKTISVNTKAVNDAEDDTTSTNIEALYNAENDMISLSGGNYTAETILHELGHAVDAIGSDANSYQTEKNDTFKNIFKEEMNEYIRTGHKRCSQDINSEDVENMVYSEGDTEAIPTFTNSNYATLDEQEMFAECYSLLINGTCSSQEVIDKYFPKTRDYVLKIIKETRELPSNIRH